MTIHLELDQHIKAKRKKGKKREKEEKIEKKETREMTDERKEKGENHRKRDIYKPVSKFDISKLKNIYNAL